MKQTVGAGSLRAEVEVIGQDVEREWAALEAAWGTGTGERAVSLFGRAVRALGPLVPRLRSVDLAQAAETAAALVRMGRQLEAGVEPWDAAVGNLRGVRERLLSSFPSG